MASSVFYRVTMGTPDSRCRCRRNSSGCAVSIKLEENRERESGIGERGRKNNNSFNEKTSLITRQSSGFHLPRPLCTILEGLFDLIFCWCRCDSSLSILPLISLTRPNQSSSTSLLHTRRSRLDSLFFQFRSILISSSRRDTHTTHTFDRITNVTWNSRNVNCY